MWEGRPVSNGNMMELVSEESYVKFQRVSFFCVGSLLFSALCPTFNQLSWSRGGGGVLGFVSNHEYTTFFTSSSFDE